MGAAGHGQNLLIKRKVRNGFAQPLVFQLKPAQLFELIRAHAAIPLAPAVVCELGYADLANGIDPRLSLPQ